MAEKCHRLRLKPCGDPAVRGTGRSAVCGNCLYCEKQQLRREYDETEKKLATLAAKLSDLACLDELSRKLSGKRRKLRHG
jgi:hypothetical protein